MALIDLTPIMTSDTTPAPYTLKASSTYANGYKIYGAFDGVYSYTADAGWMTSYSKSAIGEWVDFNFGLLSAMSEIHLGAYLLSSKAVTKVDILVSLDGNSYTKIIDNADVNYLPETNYYGVIKFDKVYILKNIRVVIKDCKDPKSYSGFNEIKMFFDDSIKEEEQKPPRGTMSSLTTLPMNTTENILLKELDHREGLLGMANDKENYGDLYVVGFDGKSHLAKSASKSDILFEGDVVMNSNGGTSIVINFENDITKYRFILIRACVTGISGAEGLGMTSQLVNTSDIHFDDTIYSIGVGVGATHYFIMHYKYTSNKSITIVESYINGWSGKISVKSIIGIY